VPRRAGDLQAPADGLDAVEEPAQPRAAGRVGAAGAVVGDGDGQRVAGGRDVDLGGTGLGVLDDVRERLGHEEVGGRLDRRVETVRNRGAQAHR
jgi:hypothetical protein